MALDREPFYEALRQRLADVTGLVVTRRFRTVASVPSSEQPILFLVENEEDPAQQMGLPPRWGIRPGLLVYARVDDPENQAGAVINPILTKIEAALEATPEEHEAHREAYATTLGGLVTYCWQSGPTVIERGDQGHQLVAYIPLDMLVAG